MLPESVSFNDPKIGEYDRHEVASRSGLGVLVLDAPWLPFSLWASETHLGLIS